MGNVCYTNALWVMYAVLMHCGSCMVVLGEFSNTTRFDCWYVLSVKFYICFMLDIMGPPVIQKVLSNLIHEWTIVPKGLGIIQVFLCKYEMSTAVYLVWQWVLLSQKSHFWLFLFVEYYEH